jgi:predicted transcriptional regulator
LEKGKIGDEAFSNNFDTSAESCSRAKSMPAEPPLTQTVERQAWTVANVAINGDGVW